MSKTTIFLMFLIIVYVALFILQLWFEVFEGDIFFKLTLTFVAVFITTAIVLLVKRHVKEEGELKRDKFVD